MKLPPYFLVIGIESMGLWGEAFAVGGVVISTAPQSKKSASFQDSFLYACNPALIAGEAADRAWVERNVKLPDDLKLVAGPAEVRAQFWSTWLYWQTKGAWLASAAAWPVHARFLLQCCAEPARRSDAPVVVSVADYLLAAGRDPLSSFTRRRLHSPLQEAQRAAQAFYKALLKLPDEPPAPEPAPQQEPSNGNV